jgi:hypothetical protein
MGPNIQNKSTLIFLRIQFNCHLDDFCPDPLVGRAVKKEDETTEDPVKNGEDRIEGHVLVENIWFKIAYLPHQALLF